MFAPETAGAQEKALLKRPGSSRPGCERFRAAQAGLRHSVGAACLLPRPGGRGSTSSWGLRASGDPRPAERGALGRTPQAWGGDAWPSGGSSDDIPGLPGLMGFVASRSTPSEALHLVGLFQEDLAQNDPHWGVCLDGEAQCFQGTKGRVHLTFCHTLVEGAYLEIAIRAPRVPQGG